MKNTFLGEVGGEILREILTAVVRDKAADDGAVMLLENSFVLLKTSQYMTLAFHWVDRSFF